MLKADLHVHSRASYDAEGCVESILERAKDVGLDAVAVTDHDKIKSSLRAVEIAPSYGLVGIPGVEVSTANGHLLALGVEEIPEIGRPVAETIDEVREMGGYAVVPHPFQKMRHGVGAVTECDGFETYNSRLFTGIANRRAERFASKNGLTPTGGSDAHTVGMVGQAYTLLGTDDDSVEGILSA
ncbi:MAG: PHP domain-containing protein, partial [Halobacteria archaeon]|nr:PHP domain-containing protein [Halobacteria archaeon]